MSVKKPKGYYERYRAIVWEKPKPKPRRKPRVRPKPKVRPPAYVWKPTLEDLEKVYPGGQKHLARSLGVSPRTIRYWKTEERYPTQVHSFKMLHSYRRADRYLEQIQDKYNISRDKAIVKCKRYYERREAEEPEAPESDKWIPLYPEKG